MGRGREVGAALQPHGLVRRGVHANQGVAHGRERPGRSGRRGRRREGHCALRQRREIDRPDSAQDRGYEIHDPQGLAFDDFGHLYVLDRAGIAIFTPYGGPKAPATGKPNKNADSPFPFSPITRRPRRPPAHSEKPARSRSITQAASTCMTRTRSASWCTDESSSRFVRSSHRGGRLGGPDPLPCSRAVFGSSPLRRPRKRRSARLSCSSTRRSASSRRFATMAPYRCWIA